MVAAPLIAAVTTSVSTIAIVGATISAVGALSGSKDLAKIGGLIGLAGGVMSMAGAGTGAVSGESLVGAEEFAANAGVGAPGATETVASAGDAARIADDIANGAASGENVLAGGNAADTAIQGAGSVNETAASVVSGGQPAGATPTSPTGVVGGPGGTVNPQQFLQGGDAARITDDLANGYASAPTTSGPASLSGDGILNSIMKFGKENKEITSAVLNGVARGFTYPADRTRAEADMMRARSNLRLTDAQLAELDRQRAARSYIPGSVGFSLNENANLHAGGGYRAPVRGILNANMG